MIGIIELSDAGAQFIGNYVGDGVFLDLHWIRTPAQIEARDAHRSAGAKTFRYTKGELKPCAVDVLPVGDRVVWSAADFAWVGS